MFKIEQEDNHTTNKCIRFPNELLVKINNVIQKNNITFSKFVVLACIYALDNLEKDTNE